MFGRIPLESHLALDSCFLADFWLLIRFPYWLWVCSNFQFLPVSVLVMYVSRNLYISSSLPIYWHIIAHNILLLLLLFLLCWLWSLLFHSWFYLFGSFFFLIRLASGLSILLILSKNQLLVSLICSTVVFLFVCFFWFQ